MAKLGGRILAVSVDEPKQSREFVRRNALPFTILSDVDRAVIRSYGVLHPGGGVHGDDIALPALFLINRDGEIVWRRIAVRIQDRPDPQTIIDEIRRGVAH